VIENQTKDIVSSFCACAAWSFMPEKMPEMSRAFIEAECLKVASREQGCSDLQRVTIGHLRPSGSGPNWEVLGFSPALPELAFDYAMRAIDRLRQKYALKRD
jgi:hypothetical protein